MPEVFRILGTLFEAGAIQIPFEQVGKCRVDIPILLGTKLISAQIFNSMSPTVYMIKAENAKKIRV